MTPTPHTPTRLIAPSLWRRMACWLYEGVLLFGVLFGLGFRQLSNPKHAYFSMASIVVASGVTTLLFNIKGHRGILFGHDENRDMLTVPAALIPETKEPKATNVIENSEEEQQA